MMGTILDGAYIFDSMGLGHNNNIENHGGVLRSIEDGVYIFDSIDLGHNNMENNGGVLRSIEDGVYIFDSMNLGHNHDIENNGEVSRVQPASQKSIKNLERVIIQGKEDQSSSDSTLVCSICLGILSNGSEAVRIPHPCSHIFHQHCITKWLNMSNTCPLCRRTI